MRVYVCTPTLNSAGLGSGRLGAGSPPSRQDGGRQTHTGSCLQELHDKEAEERALTLTGKKKKERKNGSRGFTQEPHPIRYSIKRCLELRREMTTSPEFSPNPYESSVMV